MAFFNDRLILIHDSLKNINLFRLIDGEIIQYFFDSKTQMGNEKNLCKEVRLEYSISIDKEDYIYLLYQDMSLNLILTLLKNDDMETIKLTEKPIPEVYNLDIVVKDKEPHIFYCILLSEQEKKYRIYHHYFNGVDWETYIVDEIKVREFLNPIKIIQHNGKIVIAYYGSSRGEQLYIKSFDLEEKTWEEKIELISSNIPVYYIDFLIIKNKLHIVYCEHDGNMVVKYKRFNYIDDFVQKEVEETLSNEESPMYPTLIYYDDKLWTVWVEYENIMSRYSTDKGNTWSPVYLWKESKGKNIVRYKYLNIWNTDNNILDYTFGKIYPEITFVGFGPLNNTMEIPLKKKTSFKTLKL